MSFLQNDGLQSEDDSASGVTMVEGRKMNATVTFMDWANKSHDYGGGKRKSLDLERMGSGLSCGDSSVSGDYVCKTGLGNGQIGHWLEQMQIHQRQYDMGLRAPKAADEVYLKYPFESIGYERERDGGAVENKGSPGATGEGKSLRAQWSPGATGEENKGSPHGATGEEKSRRVHMFDKAVTPSDVGKLNRLVIPKHHAEKYFPLDSSEKDKGLLLSFRDSAGKEWRFRYSYWSSSQSYVLTKGWSRFVREMQLHAGDVVSFHRAAADPHNMQQHFYITCKRRAAKAPLFFSPFEPKSPPLPHSQRMSFTSPMPAAAPPWAERLPPTEPNWGRAPPQFIKLKPVGQPPVENATEKPIKRVRLFGVNL